MTAPHGSDVAFTEAVLQAQTQRGSRAAIAQMNENRAWPTEINDDLTAFLADRDSAYIATVSSDGRPYIQHRGGPKGFLQPLDRRTIGFADFSGNRQYISIGNVAGNDHAHMFLMDYANRRRVKLWGSLRVEEEDAELLQRLTPQGYRARPERAMLFRIDAWDVNCPQHITPRHDEATIARVTEKLYAQIAALEAENAALKARLPG